MRTPVSRVTHPLNPITLFIVLSSSGPFAHGQFGSETVTPLPDYRVNFTVRSAASDFTTEPKAISLPETSETLDASAEADISSAIQATPIVRAKLNRRFKPYPSDAPPTEKWLHEMLDQPVHGLHFSGDTTLLEVLNQISSSFSTQHGDTPVGTFRMKFLEDRGELGLVGIDSLEEVDISEIEFDDILLRSALNLIFQQTNDDTRSPEPLTYVIRDEVVVITTVAKADSDEMKATRVYDVGHLLRSNGNQNIALNGRSLADNANSRSVETLSSGAMRVSDIEEGLWSFPVDSSGHPSANPRPPALIRMIISTTINEDFDNWRYPYGQGMFGSAELFGSKLVVTQSPAMHLRIVRLLNLLSEPSTAQPQGR